LGGQEAASVAGAVTSKPPLKCPGCAILNGVDVDELQHALGGIVLETAYMERVLRTAFSALIGSKYAAVVDGRLMAAALIEDCEENCRLWPSGLGRFEVTIKEIWGSACSAQQTSPKARPVSPSPPRLRFRRPPVLASTAPACPQRSKIAGSGALVKVSDLNFRSLRGAAPCLVDDVWRSHGVRALR